MNSDMNEEVFLVGQYAKPQVLVEPDWVQANIGNPTVRLLEVDVDTSAYEEGHIAGAVKLNWKTQLQDQLRRDLISREDLQKLFRSLGIRNTDTLVLYGDNNNWFAAYFYWVLKLYGHDDVRLMNGGRKKWLADGRPITLEEPVFPPSDYVAPPVDESLRARRQEVFDLLDRVGKDAALVDVRSPQEFTGEILAPPGLQEWSQRGGHIPGAANVPWSQAVNDDGTFKSAEELSALYAAKGVTPDKDVVSYCRIGERSAHSWFVLHELLGYENVRNYDGSWTEWGSMIDMPIEKP